MLKLRNLWQVACAALTANMSRERLPGVSGIGG